EIGYVADEIVEVDFAETPGHHHQNGKSCQHQQRLPPAASDFALVIGEQSLEARLRYAEDAGGHGPRALRQSEGRERRKLAAPLSAQERFLRMSLTNWIMS